MRAAVVLSGLVLMLAACEGGDASVERSTQLQQTSGAESLRDDAKPSSGSDEEFDLEAEYALKKGMVEQGLQTRVSPIDWEEARGFRRLEGKALNEKARGVLRDASLPVLLPAHDDLLGRGLATLGEHWYGLSMPGDEHTVYVSGNHKEVVIAQFDLLERRPDLKDDFLVSRIDGVVELTFRAFGASYTLEVECARPDTDTRCTADDYIIELANDLALANPRGAK